MYHTRVKGAVKKNLIEKGEFQIKNIYKTNQEIEVHTVFCLKKFGDNINENVKQYYKISNMRNTVAHASEHGKGFFSYIQKQYPKDGAFKNKQYGDIEKEIRDYLDGFERLYAQTDKEKVKRIVDLA